MKKFGLFFCLLLLAVNSEGQSQIKSSGLRFGQRNRLYKQLNGNRFCNADLNNNILEEFEGSLKTLADGLTLKEDITELAQNNVTNPKSQDFRASLSSENQLLSGSRFHGIVYKNLEAKVANSLLRALNFYSSHLQEIKSGDGLLSLKMLKEIDNKHGAVLQKQFSLNELLQKAYDSAEHIDQLLARQWKNPSGGRNGAPIGYWKDADVLNNRLSKIDGATLNQIGSEKEGLWGVLNGECQMAIVSRCEVPHICERVLLDPVPRSQYLLTHQIFQRQLIDNSNCPNLRKFVSTDEQYATLCTKAYLEAQYLELLDVPINQRDLFAELVGFCGSLGYTNFLREDWLERILSWQSKSESGCFVEDPLTPACLITTDMAFQRKATEKELQQGILQPNEKCLPHLTAVSLTAIMTYWDYLMDHRDQHFEL